MSRVKPSSRPRRSRRRKGSRESWEYDLIKSAPPEIRKGRIKSESN